MARTPAAHLRLHRCQKLKPELWQNQSKRRKQQAQCAHHTMHTKQHSGVTLGSAGTKNMFVRLFCCKAHILVMHRFTICGAPMALAEPRSMKYHMWSLGMRTTFSGFRSRCALPRPCSTCAQAGAGLRNQSPGRAKGHGFAQSHHSRGIHINQRLLCGNSMEGTCASAFIPLQYDRHMRG